jgi:Right handed beta helix region
MRRLFLIALALLAATVSYSFADSSSSTSTTYYVSPSGSDSNPGSASAPWQTVGRVNRASLQPGDTVLFQGGQTFSGGTLSPSASGSASDPITFGSYGTGRAQLNNAIDVWIPPAEHDLTFSNLDYTGSGILFASAATGSGTSNITISNSAFHDTPQAAINIAQPADHDWTVTNSTFTHTGDSAIFIWGANNTISHCTITDTGWNPAITWGTHGIYDKGPDNTIADNDISNDSRGQAISIRFHGARVYGNTIHDTGYGIAFFDYDTASGPQGTSYIYDNRFWNISGYGFYYSNQTDPQGNPPTVNFVLASNTFTFNNSTEAVNVSEVPAGATITLANNIFTGSYGSAYRGCPTCTENNNDWYGGHSNVPNGRGDKHVNPALSPAPQLSATASSPVRAAGTPLVRGLSYKAVCDGGVLHYCGARPDLGALVTASAVTSRLASGSKTASSTRTEKSGGKASPARARVAKRARTGIRYFTYKKNVKLRGGRTLHYARNKGYYAA